MKFFFDFLPVILFFVTFKLYGIYIATATAIAASIIQVIYLYLSNKKVGKAPIITMLLLVVMGGATIYFQDDQCFKLATCQQVSKVANDCHGWDVWHN